MPPRMTRRSTAEFLGVVLRDELTRPARYVASGLTNRVACGLREGRTPPNDAGVRTTGYCNSPDGGFSLLRRRAEGSV